VQQPNEPQRQVPATVLTLPESTFECTAEASSISPLAYSGTRADTEAMRTSSTNSGEVWNCAVATMSRSSRFMCCTARASLVRPVPGVPVLSTDSWPMSGGRSATRSTAVS
jgi:hypothetical protein